MRYVDEYRREEITRGYVEAIRRITTRPWLIMEICGGQTHTILQFGLDGLLPAEIGLAHGPGCPVCVTPVELIDKAIALASRPQVILCSFGDMLRVPGSRENLLMAKARGGDVRVVYSPLDAVNLARQNPAKEVVFFAVGFETTAPANAMAVWQADKANLRNFSILSAHVLVPPAIEAILSSPDNRVQGFLAPGHVCTITGCGDYEPLAEKYGVPIVVTGFEPVDILQGIYMTVRRLEEGRRGVAIQYTRSVRREGNVQAQELIQMVFEVTDRTWRGIGMIPQSGLRLWEKYAFFDAERRFALAQKAGEEATECIAGLILQGMKKPPECPAFGAQCRPEHPLGAPMVSSEGACAAYYRYGRARHEAKF